MAGSHVVVGKFISKFTVLRGAARELWLTFAIKLLGFAAYTVTNLTLKRWLSTEFGYSDQQALGLVAVWSITMTIVTLLVGALTDAIGLRKTFFLGVWVCLLGRAMMVLAPTPGLAIALGLFPLAAGEALGTPVLVAAVRKYSTTPQRSIAFSGSYMMINIGSLVAAFLFDGVREHFGELGRWRLPGLGLELTTYRTLFLVSFGLELLIWPLVWLIRPNVDVTDAGLKFVPPADRQTGAPRWGKVSDAIAHSLRETVRITRALFRQPGFYRLLVFLLLIAFLKLIFMQMYYVFPEFGIRELGDGAPVGKLWAINAMLIIGLVPIVGALTQRFSAYAMVMVGGVLSAASVFIMALPPVWFQPLAASGPGQWLGHYYLGLTGEVHPYYVMIALYVVVLSFGEAFYSPRVYEYASAIAPAGQEASYGALSYVPFLLAKLLIGTFSGTLLARYCPANGERHSGTMWLFVALTASIAPAGLILFRKLIRVPEAGREN
ncbi:MAG TPA: MFS transporter [Verrucomicrobiae bacterium]|nr:MFS transporter [Verrucomicrobiae bacterium]